MTCFGIAVPGYYTGVLGDPVALPRPPEPDRAPPARDLSASWPDARPGAPAERSAGRQTFHLRPNGTGPPRRRPPFHRRARRISLRCGTTRCRPQRPARASRPLEPAPAALPEPPRRDGRPVLEAPAGRPRTPGGWTSS